MVPILPSGNRTKRSRLFTHSGQNCLQTMQPGTYFCFQDPRYYFEKGDEVCSFDNTKVKFNEFCIERSWSTNRYLPTVKILAKNFHIFSKDNSSGVLVYPGTLKNKLKLGLGLCTIMICMDLCMFCTKIWIRIKNLIFLLISCFCLFKGTGTWD